MEAHEFTTWPLRPIAADAEMAEKALRANKPYYPIEALWPVFDAIVADGLMFDVGPVNLNDGYRRREFRLTDAGLVALTDAVASQPSPSVAP